MGNVVSISSQSAIPAASFMTVRPVFPFGSAGIDSNASFFTRMFNGLNGRKSVSMRQYRNIMGRMRFEPTSRIFTMHSAEFVHDESSDIPLGRLVWQNGMSSLPSLESVVSISAALIDPELANRAEHLLIPVNDGAWMIGALEFSMAERADRPIIGGVRHPTYNEMAQFRALERKGGSELVTDVLFSNRISNFFFRPRNFERSGKLYRWLGVGQFKKVLRLVGKALNLIVAAPVAAISLLSSKPAEGKKGSFRDHLKSTMETIQNGPKSKKGGNRYFIGNTRTIETVAEFSMATRRNEAAHSAAVAITLPILVYAISSGFIPTSVTALYILNLYASLVQRYNRARAENTIDLKLGRGKFEFNPKDEK